MSGLGAVVASSAGVNMKQRLALFLCFRLTSVLVHVAIYLLCIIPCVLVGARAAQIGSTTGSKDYLVLVTLHCQPRHNFSVFSSTS